MYSWVNSRDDVLFHNTAYITAAVLGKEFEVLKVLNLSRVIILSFFCWCCVIFSIFVWVCFPLYQENGVIRVISFCDSLRQGLHLLSVFFFCLVFAFHCTCFKNLLETIDSSLLHSMTSLPKLAQTLIMILQKATLETFHSCKDSV